MGCFNSEDVKRLLHNKYVAVLGDSIQRSVYKDLVKMLQSDDFLSIQELRKKGEITFANDTLVEGGSLCEMHNGVNFREVRQYQSGHHLVRFYFLTRVYSEYVESVLTDFKNGPQPDVLIINSCIWDLIRYEYQPLESYKTHLDCLFRRLIEVLIPECLVIWNMTMPVGFKDGEMPEYIKHNLRWDIVEGNFFSATLANFYKLDVVDMHYHFRFDLRSRCKDAIHWNQLAHRKYTQILLAHIAQAWGVQPPDNPKVQSLPIQCDPSMWNAPHPHPHFVPEGGQHGFGPPMNNAPLPPVFPFMNVPHPHPPYNDQENDQQYFEPVYFNGYTAFDVTDDRQMIENVIRGPVPYPANQMGANAFSPFVDDSPLLVGNFPPRNAGFHGYGEINFRVPPFDVHPFGGRTIAPIHYNTPMPQETWRGPQRFPRRRERQMHPYQRHPPFPTRI
ncbi:PC-esterase domain-containing protein 1A-like [Mantella aurantiaca]